MTSAPGPGPSRRTVLAGGGLLLVAACTGSSPDLPAPLTADQKLARRVARDISALAAAYAATIAAHPTTRRLLAPLAAEHAAHLVVLGDLQPAPTTSSTASPTASPSASAAGSPPSVPPSAKAARVSLAAAERVAASRRRSQAGAAGPELARLLASIAACEAVHAALVAP